MTNVINFPTGLDRAIRVEAKRTPEENRKREEERIAALKHHKGSKYEATRDLDVAEVAKLIRKDLKNLQARGELPGHLKFRVTISRYSMGRSITITIDGGLWPTYRGDVLDARRTAGIPRPWLCEEARDVEEKCEAVLADYNRDDSDSMTDYYAVKFAAHVAWGN